MSIGVVLFIFKAFGNNQANIDSKTEVLSLMHMLETDLEYYMTDCTSDKNSIRIKNGKGLIKYIFAREVVIRYNQLAPSQIEFKIPSPVFFIEENNKGLKLELWSEQTKDTIDIYHLYSNRYICTKNGYLNNGNRSQDF